MISMGSDHRGFEIKASLKEFLKSLGHEVLDCGTHNTDPCDYPDIAESVALSLVNKQADRGILLCMSGIGMTIVANKVKGIRAALCHTSSQAEMSRKHNDANVLVLASKEAGEDLSAIVVRWLKTDFEGGRHERRVNKIKEIEGKT